MPLQLLSVSIPFRSRRWTTDLQCHKTNLKRAWSPSCTTSHLNRAPQRGALCEECNSGRDSSKNDLKGIFGFLFRSRKNPRWTGANRSVSPLSGFYGLLFKDDPSSRVFKPKDEEPYGRLNPKVHPAASHLDLCYLTAI